jgi:hypothetical protein
MKTLRLSERLSNPAWWRNVALRREQRSCIHRRGIWRRLSARYREVSLEGTLYCLDECLEVALLDTLRGVRVSAPPAPISHRIPLGLLLLSRQQLTEQQLRTALEAQRVAGRGRIGEWLQTLGFASEHDVTAALARQWSCPLLRANSFQAEPRCRLQIPAALLERFFLIPLHFAEATSTLHLAFGETPDYAILYAIERMLGCRTECCLAEPSFVRRSLAALSNRRGECEVSLTCEADSEFSRIVCGYCARLAASEVRLAACGPFVWVRLFARARAPLDLWMHFPLSPSPALSAAPLPSRPLLAG